MTEDSPDSNLRVLQDVTVHVNSIGKDEIRNSSPWTTNAISIFAHARQLLIASMVLLERHLPGPTFVLQRPLFEDSLRLAEFANSSEAERVALMASWRHVGLRQIEGLAQKAIQDGAKEEAVKLRAHVMDQSCKINTALKKHGVIAKDFMKVEKAATKLGRGDDYPAYKMSHQAVHGNDLVHLISREASLDGVIVIGKPRQEYIDGIAEFAARSGLHLARSFHTITSTASDDTALGRLEMRLEALSEVADGEVSAGH